MGVCEPLRTRAAHSALAAGPRHHILPFLRPTLLEELQCPFQLFGEQLRDEHKAFDIGEPLLVPIGDASGLDKLAEVLVAGAAKLHPPTIRTFEAAAPDATRRRGHMRGVMHAHSTGADRWEGGIEQGHFNALPDAVALSRE